MAEQLEGLRDIAARTAGLRYDSGEAQAIHGEGDWAQYYPEVDGYGYLTGRVIGGNDDGYLVVDDVAMVDASIYRGRRRGQNPVDHPGIYYHVAGDGWALGQPLRSYDRREAMEGEPPPWKWGGEPIDTDVVALHDNLAEAQEHAEEFGGTILIITVPEHAEDYGILGAVVEEGYPAIYDEIPADMISIEEAQ